MTTKKQLKQEISQIDEAIEWLEDFVLNLKAGNTITKKAAKEFTTLVDALSSMATVKGEANPVEKEEPFDPVGKIIWDKP